MNEIEKIQKEIEDIKKRNCLVEADKAWETSWLRRGLIAAFTYFIIGLFMSSIEVDRPWINAIVPTCGFLLSTLTLPFFKKLWLKKYK
jgi:tetrahydromethanopterin S-methyltransferase subunit F